jgi:phosphoserine phosphatase
VALLRGTPSNALERVYDERLLLTEGAEELIKATKKAGLSIALLSGGFDFFAERLKDRLKLDFAFSNHLEVKDGLITGQIVGQIVDAGKKDLFVRQVSQQLNICLDDVIVVGDGANDIDMMKGAGLSIAFHAKEIVRHAADYTVRFGSLATVVDWLKE